jgi:hypothetical protein
MHDLPQSAPEANLQNKNYILPPSYSLFKEQSVVMMQMSFRLQSRIGRQCEGGSPCHMCLLFCCFTTRPFDMLSWRGAEGKVRMSMVKFAMFPSHSQWGDVCRAPSTLH